MEKEIEDEDNIEEEKEEKSINELERDMKNLQGMITTTKKIMKNKFEKKIIRVIKQEVPPPAQAEKITPTLVKEEIKVETDQEEDIKNLWQLYKWADNPEKYPWMYWIPSERSGAKNWIENLESWKNDWSKFTLDWARAFILHILNLMEISGENPFRNLNEREKALNLICNHLIGMKIGDIHVAEWFGKNKNKLRVYWRSLDEWANMFYEWAYNGGGDVFTLTDLKKAGEDLHGFGTLPEEDLKKIIEILIKQKKARWIDKKLMRVEILFKGF